MLMVALVTTRRDGTQQVLLGEVARFERHESSQVLVARSTPGCCAEHWFLVAGPNSGTWRISAGNPDGASKSGRRRCAGCDQALKRVL
jgi:hypothetical protein